MGRTRKEFNRTSGIRDAKLMVIATEGEITEPRYFEILREKEEYFNPKIHVEIIPTVEGKSSPKYVLAQLDNFKKEYRIREDDELWMVIDRDFKSWTIAELSDCMTKCKQKRYELCISNPCFEIWILLHLICIKSQTIEIKNKIKANKKIGSRTYCELKILESLGAYNKSNPDFNSILEHTEIALDRAKNLTENNSVNLFDQIGTDLNILVNRIINGI